MRTSMTAQESKGQPTTIDILRRSSNKAAHVVTPEGETTKSEGESATQVTQHTRIGRSGITTPV